MIMFEKIGLLCLNPCLLEKIKKGGMSMENYKNIDNTRYVINRVFGENTTTAKLIEQRIIKDKKTQPLTGNGSVMYNNISGSIQSKEVL